MYKLVNQSAYDTHLRMFFKSLQLLFKTIRYGNIIRIHNSTQFILCRLQSCLASNGMTHVPLQRNDPQGRYHTTKHID